MSMLGYMSDADLADIRAQADSFMSDTCYVLRKANTTDSAGNVVEGFTQAGPYSCRFAHLERVEGVFGGTGFERELSKIWYTVSLPVGTTVTLGDRLQRGSEIFEILRHYNDETLQIAKRLLVVAIEGDAS